MLAEFIDRIRQLTPMKTVEVDGVSYWDKNGQRVDDPPPPVSPVAELNSLDALLSAFEAPELAGFGKMDNASVQIVVKDPCHVSVVTAADCEWAKRDHYIDATWNGQAFPFGQWLDTETFIIRTLCQIVESKARDNLISFVSSITANEVITNEDDGFSQSTTVIDKQSGRKGVKDFSPILTLSPYRTFPEVAQPESRFLLRMRKGREDPEVALFEADGGLWVSTAVRNVASYLRSDERVKSKGIAVIG